MYVYDSNGTVVELGDVINAGGEGEVRAVVGDGATAAKLYREPTPERRAKIQNMVALYDKIMAVQAGVLRAVCWPRQALYADSEAAEFIGFLMRRAPVGSVAASELYRYPRTAAGLSALTCVDALIALTRVFDALHHTVVNGHALVVGDLSGDNVLVAPDGGVHLIDADTFYVQRGGAHPCVACAPGVAAPELIAAAHGRTYAQMEAAGEPTFTVATDLFALAVLVFRMLGNGVHPFEGAVEPDAEGEYPLPPAVDCQVRDGRSPFTGTAPGVGLFAWALPLDHMPPLLREAYDRALFSGTDGASRRVTDAQWGRLLRDYRAHLVECGHGHVFHRGFVTAAGAPACPYCAADRRVARMAQAPAA